MSLESIVVRELKVIGKKVSVAAQNSVVRNRDDRSSVQVTTSFGILRTEIIKELDELVEKLHKTEMKSKEINWFEQYCNEFILKQYEYHKHSLIVHNTFYRGHEDEFSDFIDLEIEKVNSNFAIKVLILEREIRSKKRKVYWEIGKMILSGFIGGMITLYLRNKYGK